MYPTFFRIGNFDVTSFGVMVAIGALVGLWVFGRELARSGLPASATDAAMAGVFGGLVGAKLLWVAEHVGEERLRDLLLSRGGMSWFGGLLGGVGGGGGEVGDFGVVIRVVGGNERCVGGDQAEGGGVGQDGGFELVVPDRRSELSFHSAAEPQPKTPRRLPLVGEWVSGWVRTANFEP